MKKQRKYEKAVEIIGREANDNKEKKKFQKAIYQLEEYKDYSGLSYIMEKPINELKEVKTI